MSLVTVPAVLLRSHPYSESSLILRFLTPDHGIVSVMAKGVRKRSSRGETPLETFQRGALTFLHREERDLHGFRDFKASSSSRPLAGDLLRFSGASFLAELVLSHILQEANTALFEHLVSLLERLGVAPDEEVPGLVLSGAWTLLLDFGFPPSLDACLACGRPLPGPGFARFDVAGGGLRCEACSTEGAGPRLGPEAQAAVRAMVVGASPVELRGAPAHLALVERYALHHLDGCRPFHATTLLRAALRKVEAEGGEPAGPEGSREDPGPDEGERTRNP